MNHLNWISGVRMGHNDSAERKNSSSSFEDDGPTNLGEEVSIVGHKFPKIRFEKYPFPLGIGYQFTWAATYTRKY